MEFVTQAQLLQLLPKLLLLTLLGGFIGAGLWHAFFSVMARAISWLADRWARADRVRIARARALALAKLSDGHG